MRGRQQGWERVQELRKQRKRPNRYDEVGLFSGILFCADCGSVMYQQRYQTDKRRQDCYICGSYKKRTADYEAEQKELKEKAAVLQGELSKTLEATANAEKFMKVVRKYTSFEELTPTLLREFVEKIVIHESEALDGKRRGKLRRQEIEIYYSFVGKVELPD